MRNSRIFYAIMIPFSRKHRFITSFLFFFLLALAYLYFAPNRYRVSLKLVLRDASAGLADTIKSKSFIKKAVDQLPFGVSYYAENEPKKEEFGDDLPVNLVLSDPEGENYDKNLIITAVSSHSYSIEHEDTIQFYEINAPVNQYYGKFRVVRGPAFNPHFATQVVKFNNQFDVYEEFYHNINLKKTDQPNTIILSITTTSPMKGKVFLDKLLELCCKSTASPTKGLANEDSLQLFKRQIAALRTRAKEKPASKQARGPAPSAQQIRTLQTIRPYLQKPVQQFVQVPYVEEVENIKLRNDLSQYNKAELAKQRLLGETKVDDLAVANVDKKLSTLKAELLNDVDELSGTHKPNTKTTFSRSVERELQAALTKYKNLIGRQPVNKVSADRVSVKVAGNPQGEVVIVQPNAFWVGALALILSVTVPLLFTLMGILNESIATRKWFDSQNVIEKIKILIGTKQID